VWCECLGEGDLNQSHQKLTHTLSGLAEKITTKVFSLAFEGVAVSSPEHLLVRNTSRIYQDINRANESFFLHWEVTAPLCASVCCLKRWARIEGLIPSSAQQ
jgi:hypothetical protein